MAQIKINNIIYGSNNSADIIYKNTTVEEKLNSIPVFDPSDNTNIEGAKYDYLTYGHIVDTLTSDANDKVLSAKQGKILNEKFDNIDFSSLENAIAENSESISSLNSNVVSLNGKLNTQVMTLSDNIDENSNKITTLNNKVPFSFGIDANGNYGYYKDGADTVIPFNDIKSGEAWLRSCRKITTSHNYGGGMTGSFYIDDLDFSDIDSFIFSYSIGTSTKAANTFRIYNSNKHLVNVDPARDISNQIVYVNNTTLPCTVQISVSYSGANYLTIHSYIKHGVIYYL